MAYFSTLLPADRAKALGNDMVDASNGILFARDASSKDPLRLEQQFLVIGLGGSGIKTVDRIKGDLKRQYTWGANQVAFLAIDTDDGDLKSLVNLDDSEKYQIKDDAGIESRHNIESNREDFTKDWIYPNFFEHFDHAGAGQNRAISHAKMFDGAAGNYVDQRLINRIRHADAPFTNAKPTEIIIILGVSGGTGSGGLINIAHFVREALKARVDYHITGYFYMPDVFQYPTYTDSKKANGYAALKELDYYYCARQRTETDLLKAHGTVPLEVNQVKVLYDTSYLVSGSVDGATVDPYNTAINAVKESVTNLLTEDQTAKAANALAAGKTAVFLMDSFMSNSETERSNVIGSGYAKDGAGIPTGKEMPGFFGEDVYNYNAIGVGTASVPSELIKSYAVDRVVKNVLDVNSADGAPGTAVARAIKWGDGALPSTAGKAEIGKLLTFTPGRVKEIIRNRVTLQLSANLRASITRDDALAGTAGAKILNNLGLNNGNNAKVSLFLNQVQNDVDQAYAAFEKELTNFLKKYGPSAFRSMYEGVGSDQPYEGISSVLNQYKAVGRDSVKLPQNTDGALKEKRDELAKPLSGLVPAKLANWIDAFVNNEKTKLVYDVAGGVYGAGNYYDTHFLAPVRKLCEECCEFAQVLEGLTNAYGNLANDFNSYATYSTWLNDHGTGRVYDCVQSMSDYNWAKGNVDNQLAHANYKKIRDDLVDAFMSNRKAWIDVDVNTTPRKTFDEFIAPKVNFTSETTVVSFIQYQVAAGANMNTAASNLVNQLIAKSAPLFAATTGVSMAANLNRYLLVPSGIFNGANGAVVKTAFQTACDNATPPISMQESAGVDNFVLYTLKGGLPIYALSGLSDWEFAYNAAAGRLHRNESGKGDFNPETGLEWKNYPYLSHTANPRLPDGTGSTSAEGQFLLREFDPLWNKAVEKGLINERQDANGKYYYEYYNLIHLPAWDLSFDEAVWPENSEGLLATGTDMFAYFAQKNGKTLEDITKTIRLEGQGAFSNHNLIRDNALDWAKRSLRKNVPMYLQVKKTLAAVEAIMPEIERLNGIRKAVIEEKIRKAEEEKAKQEAEAKQQNAWVKACELAPRLIACETLSEVNEDSAKWALLDEKGKGTPIGFLIARNIAKNDSLNRARCSNNLLYPALVGQLFLFMQQNPIADFEKVCEDEWDTMVEASQEGDMKMADSFKANLSKFVEEAKTFVATYDGSANKKARGKLMDSLGEADDYDQLAECYKKLLDEDKNL